MVGPVHSALYDALGVGVGATPEEIKAAYRSKAKALHPDAGGTAEEFEPLAKAYRILSNPETRAHYDATGSDEDRNEERDRMAAMSFLAELLENAIRDQEEVIHIDLVGKISGDLVAFQNAITMQMTGWKRRRRQLTNAAKRMRVRKGQNVLKMILDGKTAEADRIMTGLQEKLELSSRAKLMLEDHDFDAEAVTASAWSVQVSAAS